MAKRAHNCVRMWLNVWRSWCFCSSHWRINQELQYSILQTSKKFLIQTQTACRLQHQGEKTPRRSNRVLHTDKRNNPRKWNDGRMRKEKRNYSWEQWSNDSSLFTSPGPFSYASGGNMLLGGDSAYGVKSTRRHCASMSRHHVPDMSRRHVPIRHIQSFIYKVNVAFPRFIRLHQ